MDIERIVLASLTDNIGLMLLLGLYLIYHLCQLNI